MPSTTGFSFGSCNAVTSTNAACSSTSTCRASGAVLGALSRNADRSMSFADLVEYLAVSRQNLDAVLKRLERLGYVKRVEDPEDRRVRIVQLTSRGQAFWTDLFQQTVQFYGKATVGITTDERKQLTALLVRIGQNLKRPDF